MLGKMWRARKERKANEAVVADNAGTMTPLDVRLASSITISDLAYTLFKDLDTDVYKGDTYTIDYITEYTVFDDLVMYRIVVDDNCFLLVVDDAEDGIPDVMVFHKVYEGHPRNTEEWDNWIHPTHGMINSDSMDVDGEPDPYTEFWLSAQDVIATKYTHKGNSQKTYNHKIFARPIELIDGEESEEFLLAEVEDETKVCVYTGVTIPTIELKIL